MARKADPCNRQNDRILYFSSKTQEKFARCLLMRIETQQPEPAPIRSAILALVADGSCGSQSGPSTIVESLADFTEGCRVGGVDRAIAQEARV